MLRGYFAQLLHKVHLQRAADATILEGHKAILLLPHHAAALDKVGIDIHLAEVVDDDGELDTAAVGKDAVEEGGFAATEVAGEQQHGNLTHS